MSILDIIRGSSAKAKIPAKKQGATLKKTTKASLASKAEVSVSEPMAVSMKHADLVSVLRRPHVSEKAASHATAGVYVFEVALDAEKIAIKKAVEAMYKVNVVGVRTIRLQGKPIYRGRRPSRRRDIKKAIVTLKPGQKLELYEGV